MAKFKEQNSYDTFKSGCLGRLNLYRVENQVTAGMPDVIAINRNGAVFWLELKAYVAWPARASTCPLKGKFEAGQLSFMCAWRSWQGIAFVLLKVGPVYYLIPPQMNLEALNREDLQGLSVAVGKADCIAYLEGIE